MFKEFKKFITQGNVIDMAVGLMMGAAFTAIISSLNSDILSPLISIPLKTVNLDDWKISLGSSGATMNIGSFIQAIITFLMTAFCLFLIVKAVNKARDMMASKAEKEAKTEKSKADPTAETANYLKEILTLLQKEEKAANESTSQNK